MKFKVGDKVKIVDNKCPFSFQHKGRIGVVDAIDCSSVRINCEGLTYWHYAECLAIIKNNRGKNPRDAHGRFLPKKSYTEQLKEKVHGIRFADDEKFMREYEADFKEVDALAWGFKLPQSLTINGVKYVKEDHV